jgi:hypothetical protein
MNHTEFEVENALLQVATGYLKVKGNLVGSDSFYLFENIFSGIIDEFDSSANAFIDLTECNECSSEYLGIVFKLVQEIIKPIENMKIKVLTNDGKVMPWQDTLIKFLGHYSKLKDFSLFIEKI